jgi:hypothetical protein
MVMIYTILLVINFFLQGGETPDSKPLPELDSFLRGIRQHIHTDRIIQSQYTFTEKSIFRELNSDERIKNTETRVYEVYPSANPSLTYRKLISKNDEPPGAKDMEKSDNDYDKRRREEQRKLSEETAQQKRRREEKELEAKRKEEETIDEAFRLYKISMIGREWMEGTPVIGFTFEPRPGYTPKTDDGKILLKVHGKAWFDEESYELVRIEAELIDGISFGVGILAKIHKGTHLSFQRRKVNNEVWLPASSHFVGTGRILLFKGFRIDQETVYSDYRKFTVETEWRVAKPR